ncbi:MAG: putative ornithine cyclodeaminase mu-crystallin like protein [Chloroflexi bacterium]|nr:putative ornithine cyclodeaminase mu-crystallin like protein [Chloroflexota bacterium]
MIRLLAVADVEDLLDLDQAIACLEQVFRDQTDGIVAPWPPWHASSGGASLFVRSGGLPGRERMGIRFSTGPRNRSYAAIYETPSGRLMSFMAYPFSDLRLNASVGVGVRHLAGPDARRVGIIGTGRLATGLLETVGALRGIELVAAYSRSADNRERFASEGAQKLGIPVTAAPSAEEAVRDADIVVTATSADGPVLNGDWVPPEALVVSIGSRTELDERIYERASLIVTASRDQELRGPGSERWTLVRMIDSGALSSEAVVEVGQVIVGNVRPPSGIRVYREPQGGFSDIALACSAYERAVELGRGMEWDG